MLVAQKRKDRNIHAVHRVGEALVLQSAAGVLYLIPQNPLIVRILYGEGDTVSDDLGMGLLPQPPYPHWEHTETETEIQLKTASLTICIARATGVLQFFRPDGTLLLSEQSPISRIMEGFDAYKMVVDEDTQIQKIATPDGVKQVVTQANKMFDKRLYHTKLFLDWQANEALYGLGQAEEGVLNLRGTTQYVHQGNLKIAIPLLLSTKGYGLLLATGSPVIFNDNAYGSYLYTEASEKMDYYFIAGADFDQIIQGYRQLSGKATLLPKWAFGYIQSQERYETAAELVDTVAEYRKRDIALDCIVLDWMSWKDGLWGQKTYDETRFPDPKEMVEKLHEMHAHFMISIWPLMNEASDNYRTFLEKGLLLPASNIYNAFDPDARQLYWSQAKEGLYQYGVDGWWCDSSEPFTPEWNRLEKTGALYPIPCLCSGIQ